MRSTGLHLLLVLGLFLVMGGCTDTGTLPQATIPDAAPGLAVAADSGDYQDPACCEKVIVTVPGPDPAECDPYASLNWCEGGGDCLTAGSTGCPIGGGPGPGGGGGVVPPDNPPADTACNTSDSPVLNDAAVQTGFEDLWNQSRMNLEQSQRLESAAWIVQNADGSRHMVPFSYTQRNACAVNGNFFPPPGAVGFVHTHPFTTGERMTACGPMTYETPNGQSHVVVGRDGQPLYHTYNNQPSPRDRHLLQGVINHVRKARGEPPLDGYVLDNEGITRYVGMNGDKDRLYGRCGY